MKLSKKHIKEFRKRLLAHDNPHIRGIAKLTDKQLERMINHYPNPIEIKFTSKENEVLGERSSNVYKQSINKLKRWSK